MPVKKISKEGLKAHFRRCWAIYIIGVIVVCFLNNLVFTMTRPRAPEEETVRIMLINTYNAPSEAQQDALYYKLHSLDETINCLEIESLSYGDNSDPQVNMVLPVKVAAGYADIYVADQVGFEELLGLGALLPLEEHLDTGWLEGIEYERIMGEDSETGEVNCIAVKLDYMGLKNVYLGIAVNSTNVESTLMSAEYIYSADLDALVEEKAAAEAAEKAAKKAAKAAK